MTRWSTVAVALAMGVAAANVAVGEAESPDHAAAKTRLAEWIPVGHSDNNSCARGLASMLQFLGHDVSYDTIMGDSGQAFIIQGEEDRPNLHDGAVDVGWWPLEPVGMTIRLDFLEQTVGRALPDVLPSHEAGGYDLYRADPAAYYSEWVAPTVRASLAKGMPCIVQHGTWFVVTAQDDGSPPVTGAWACSDAGEIVRLSDGYPYNVLAPAAAMAKLDRAEADADALRYAVALHRDEVLGPDADVRRTDELRHPEYGERWRTGVRSYAAWIKALRDTDNLGQARWHSNVVYQLGINRRSAVRYLRDMAQRNRDEVASHVESAAKRYEGVLEALTRADTSQDAMASEDGRNALVGVIEEIVALEGAAAADMDEAADAIN
jgi:hypothetical protein